MEGLSADHLTALVGSAPVELDLTSAVQRATLQGLAEELESQALSLDGLRAIEDAVSRDATLPIGLRVASKLALGRATLQSISEPLHVSLVLAVYKEHHRILTAAEHPAGEDFLREKLRQLRWLFASTPRHSWDLTVVDDGCPEGSGREARTVFDDFAMPDEDVEVLFLADAIRDHLPIIGHMESTSDSRKGGAIRFGMWHAIQNQRPGHHIVAFTDADLSTHLAQIGLLAEPLTKPGVRAAIGSRREPSSVVVKAGSRDARGRLFIYLWKRLIPQLRGIIDTQCGFKAFDAAEARQWIEDVQESGFSFDVEMLVRIELGSPSSIQKVPLAWIDSEAESTTADLDPYLTMLQHIVSLYRDQLPSTPDADRFADFIEALDDEGFNRLAARVPPEIASREPADFDDFHDVTPDDLATLAHP